MDSSFIDLDTIIRLARRRYRKDGVRLSMPEQPYIPSGTDYVRASSLGLCKTQAAYEKVGREPDFPELTIDGNDNKQWITDHGSYVAPMIQLPLMYLATVTPNISFIPELPFKNEDLKLVGRLDGLLTIGSTTVALEIKDAEGQQKRSIATPKYQYAIQTLAYMLHFGLSHSFIVTASKWGWGTYTIQPEGRGFRIYESNGEVWQPPVWQTNFNNPDVLNFDTVKKHIEDMHQAIEQAKAGRIEPALDPLNDDLSFLCMSQWEKPKAYKNGNKKDGEASPNCPFAGTCHGLRNRRYTTTIQDERICFEESENG